MSLSCGFPPACSLSYPPNQTCVAPTHPIHLDSSIHPPIINPPSQDDVSLPPISPTPPVRREEMTEKREEKHDKKKKENATPHKTPSDEAEDKKYLKKRQAAAFPKQPSQRGGAQSIRTTNASLSQRSLTALWLCCCGAVFVSSSSSSSFLRPGLINPSSK